jgi:hypothetical protein
VWGAASVAPSQCQWHQLPGTVAQWGLSERPGASGGRSIGLPAAPGSGRLRLVSGHSPLLGELPASSLRLGDCAVTVTAC